jgi:hypothetical protein
MTRSKDDPKKAGDVRANAAPDGAKSITFPDGMEVEGDIKLRAIETPAQWKHRHKMEVRRFWVEEAPIHLLAIGIGVSGTVAAMVLMFRPGSSVEDKKWAFGVLSHLLIAIAGFAFGKAAK